MEFSAQERVALSSTTGKCSHSTKTPNLISKEHVHPDAPMNHQSTAPRRSWALKHGKYLTWGNTSLQTATAPETPAHTQGRQGAEAQPSRAAFQHGETSAPKAANTTVWCIVTAQKGKEFCWNLETVFGLGWGKPYPVEARCALLCTTAGFWALFGLRFFIVLSWIFHPKGKKILYSRQEHWSNFTYFPPAFKLNTLVPTFHDLRCYTQQMWQFCLHTKSQRCKTAHWKSMLQATGAVLRCRELDCSWAQSHCVSDALLLFRQP